MSKFGRFSEEKVMFVFRAGLVVDQCDLIRPKLTDSVRLWPKAAVRFIDKLMI